MENSAEEPKEKSTVPQNKGGYLKKTLAALRFLIFLSLLGAAAYRALPDTYHAYMTHPVILGGIGFIFLFFLAVFLFFSPGGTHKNESVAGAINFEAAAALLIGTIALIIFSIFSIFTSQTSDLMFYGILLVLISIYYLYTLIKTAMDLASENMEMKKKYRELAAMDREKSDFMNVTSHQLRTPLTEMRWSLEKALQDQNMSPESKSIIERGIGSVRRLVAIVEDLLRARVLEDGATDGKKDPIDLGMVIRSIVDELRDTAAQKKVDLVYNPFEHIITVIGDSAELRGAIKNVIDNAIRYSPQKTVSISLSTDKKTAQIRVEDTGIGVDMDDYGKVFQKFFRGKNAMLTQPDGSGIGLYTTKRILERYGGNINFFSQLGKGTIFMITLPRS